MKHSISPTYNHTMVYDGFHTSDLREACAELMVWQRDGIKTRILGGVRLSSGTGECACSENRYLNMFQKAAAVIVLSLDLCLLIPGQSYGESVSWMDSTEEEVAVWASMINNPNCWIEATLPIRSNLTRR